MSMFTATPQLPEGEAAAIAKAAIKSLDDDRHSLWLQAEAKFHWCMSIKWRLTHAYVYDGPHSAEARSKRLAAVVAGTEFIELVGRYVAIPCGNIGRRKDRDRDLRRWRKAILTDRGDEARLLSAWKAMCLGAAE